MAKPSNELNKAKPVGIGTDSPSVKNKKPVKSADVPGFFFPLAPRLYELVNSAVEAMPPPIVEEDEPPQTLPRLQDKCTGWKANEDGKLGQTWRIPKC